MQSVTVLLIEMEFRARLHPDEAVHITLHLEKGLEWLHSLGSISIPAQRAWAVCKSICNRLFFGPGPRATRLSDMSMLSPDRDSQGSGTSQPALFPGCDISELSNGGTFMEPYMKLPHNMTVHPALETPYDEVTVYMNAN